MRARGVLSTSLFALVLGVAGCTGMPPAATPPTTATPAPDGAQTTPAATSPTIAPPRAPETVAPSGYRQGAGATDPQGWATFEARAQLVASGLAPGIELPGDSAIPGTILKVLPARATSLVDASHVMFEVAYDPCQTRVAAWVWEDATSVVVGGTASTPSPKPAGRCLAVAGALKANLPLAAPIGGRPVLTTTGEVLVRGKVSSSSTVR